MREGCAVMSIAKPRGAGKRLTRAERREQIMETAVKLFARQGFERTTTREIAAEAGISEGTIYRYFESKRDILFGFLETVAVESLDTLISSLAGSDETQAINAFFENRLEIGAHRRDLMKVVIGEALFNQEFAGEFYSRMVVPVTAVLEKFLADKIAAGRFRQMDTTVAARTLIGYFLVFNLFGSEFSGVTDSLSRLELSEKLSALFLDGVRAVPQT